MNRRDTSYRSVGSTRIYIPSASELERARTNALPLPCGCSRWPVLAFFAAPLVWAWRWLVDYVRDECTRVRDIGTVIAEDENDHSADERLAAETRR
jgi:hypothetical protein